MKNKKEEKEQSIRRIDRKEKENLEKGTTIAKDAVIEIIKSGIDIAMNKFN